VPRTGGLRKKFSRGSVVCCRPLVLCNAMGLPSSRSPTWSPWNGHHPSHVVQPISCVKPARTSALRRCVASSPRMRRQRNWEPQANGECLGGNVTLRGTSARSTIPTVPSPPLQPRHLNSLPSPSFPCGVVSLRSAGAAHTGQEFPRHTQASPMLSKSKSSWLHIGQSRKDWAERQLFRCHTNCLLCTHLDGAARQQETGIIPKRGLKHLIHGSNYISHNRTLHPQPQATAARVSHTRLKDTPAVEHHGKLTLTPASKRCLAGRDNVF
jgi:hypothetical protein